MAILSKPIPALYTVYILRSSVRHASLYIGSTPHPPRRLKQHNGEARGGAVRTSRNSLRPWEMVAIVSGFPGMVAALKFEWALTNPHLSLHIPSNSRLSVATQRKKNGQPRRPRASLTSILSNLHLLLRVPSFSRWPLRLHFFAKDVYTSWGKCCSTSAEPMRDNMDIVTDFGPGSSDTAAQPAPAAPSDAGTNPASTAPGESWGVHALPLDYAPMKDYVAKGHSVFSFEREGDCAVCGDHLTSGEGLHAICTNDGCEAVGHLDCWGRHVLRGQGEGEETILPTTGSCPRCGGEVRWGDMMRELTLRTRGQKDVEKLLKTKKSVKAKGTGKGKGKDKTTVSATA